jgi:ribosomal protein S18 acetylase RimI-like enzyme
LDILIRKATPADTGGVMKLLLYNTGFHHINRPDIFKGGSKKYTEDEFTALLDKDGERFIFVAVDETDGAVCGFCFCELIHTEHRIVNPHSTLYIDDICVDETRRRLGIGRKLFDRARDLAIQLGVYNIDLNVWEFNETAIKFYESLGFKTQRRKMEYIL